MIRAFTVAALLSVTTLSPRPAEADQTTASGTAPVLEHTTVPLSPGTTADAMEPPRHDDNATVRHDQRSRPRLLPVLYATSAAMNAYDIYSTRRALARGARELNPLMRGVVDDTATLIALKTAVTLSTALAAERLWRDRPIAAISTVLAVNAIAAAAAVHNARVLRHQSGVVGGHTR
jgi:hypothetical protein